MDRDLRLADRVGAEREWIVAEPVEWLRIPSISAPADVRRSAGHCAALLAAAGLENVAPACDAVVASDTGMLSPGRPSVCVGMRGLAAFEVGVRCASPAELWAELAAVGRLP